MYLSLHWRVKVASEEVRIVHVFVSTFDLVVLLVKFPTRFFVPVLLGTQFNVCLTHRNLERQVIFRAILAFARHFD